MSISAKTVKELREKTGVGMMECKKALVETNGDVEAAITWLRTNSSSKVAKMHAKKASEGVVCVRSNDNTVAVIEVNCQTDFVGRDENFLAFANALADTALAQATDNIDAIMASKDDNSGDTFEAWRSALVQKIGENIHLRRVIIKSTAHPAGAYCHRGRIAAIVELDTDNADLARDIAMHVAAINPKAISPEDIPAEDIQKEKDIFVAQAAESGKPAEIIEKMVQGRIKKFQSENSLIAQSFVKDSSKTVGELLKENSANVTNFIRLELGEGIEKDANNFAEEVMAQVKGS